MDNKNNQKEPASRRRFLSLGLLAGGGLLTGSFSDHPDSDTSKNETVKMLTADGKLVEVNKDIAEKAMASHKVSNREILEWMKNPSKNENSDL